MKKGTRRGKQTPAEYYDRRGVLGELVESPVKNKAAPDQTLIRQWLAEGIRKELPPDCTLIVVSMLFQVT